MWSKVRVNKREQFVNAISDHHDDMKMADIELGKVEKKESSLAFKCLFGKTFVSDFTSCSKDSVVRYLDLTVRARCSPKIVLVDKASGSITTGFLAIIGGPQSGKTTLLNALSHRLDHRYAECSGEIRLLGESNGKMSKMMSAYVMQDDLLHAELTVRETLGYAAELRMPEGITKEAREAREEEVLRLMGIEHCKDTIVGDTRKKGISGGERKRLCVAIELLNHPKLIFLDEPTSGLDSSTALSVCQALKNLSDSGECTVVCTIHQPQPKIFNLFDNLILMKRGAIVYQGSVTGVTTYLSTLPSGRASWADYLSDQGSAAADEASDAIYGGKATAFKDCGVTSWCNQYRVLCRRNAVLYVRNWRRVLCTAVATTLLAVFIGFGFWQGLPTDTAGIMERPPSLYFVCVTQSILGSLQSINSFPSERAIMLRERSSGAYHVSSYFMAKTTVDMATQLWPPIFFSCIVYYTIGYQAEASKFLIFTVFLLLEYWAAASLAACVTCICVSVEMSTIVLSCLFEICRLYGGAYAATQEDAPRMEPWKFADFLSYIKYAYSALLLNEADGLELCLVAGQPCQVLDSDPAEAMQLFVFTAGMLMLFIVVYRCIGYCGLRFIRS